MARRSAGLRHFRTFIMAWANSRRLPQAGRRLRLLDVLHHGASRRVTSTNASEPWRVMQTKTGGPYGDLGGKKTRHE